MSPPASFQKDPTGSRFKRVWRRSTRLADASRRGRETDGGAFDPEPVSRPETGKHCLTSQGAMCRPATWRNSRPRLLCRH